MTTKKISVRELKRRLAELIQHEADSLKTRFNEDNHFGIMMTEERLESYGSVARFLFDEDIYEDRGEKKLHECAIAWSRSILKTRRKVR